MRTTVSSDPLTAKELRGIARRGQTYVNRAVYVGFVGLLVYFFWTNLMARSAYLSPSEFAELGRDLFRQFVPLQMILVSLSAVAAGADGIVKEARSGTLGLLLLTPLSPRQIALAKWKAAFSQSASLVLCGAPVLAVCVYLDGVGLLQLAASLAVTLSMAALCAAFGIRASSIYSTVPKSILMGVLYMVGYTLLPLALLFMGGWPAIFVTPFVHPVYAAVMMLAGDDPLGSVWGYGWVPSTAISFVVAIWLLKGASKRMEARAGGPVAEPPLVAAPSPAGPFSFLLGKPGGRGAEDLLVWDDRPLLWKELVTRTGARWSHESRMLFTLYGFLFILLLWLFSQGRHQGTLGFLGACFTLLALGSGAALFAPEKEARKLEMLLSAPVTSLEIVRSKLLSGLVAPEGRLVLIAGLVTALAFSWWSGPLGILATLGVFALFIAFTYVLSAACSLRAQTMAAAFLGAAGVLSVIILILPLLARLIADPTRQGSIPPAVYLVSVLNPMWVIEPLAAGAPGAALGRFSLYAAAYGSAIAVLVGFMVGRYDRIHGRA